jgi:hypothetical protein
MFFRSFNIIDQFFSIGNEYFKFRTTHKITNFWQDFDKTFQILFKTHSKSDCAEYVFNQI